MSRSSRYHNAILLPVGGYIYRVLGYQNFTCSGFSSLVADSILYLAHREPQPQIRRLQHELQIRITSALWCLELLVVARNRFVCQSDLARTEDRPYSLPLPVSARPAAGTQLNLFANIYTQPTLLGFYRYGSHLDQQ